MNTACFCGGIVSRHFSFRSAFPSVAAVFTLALATASGPAYGQGAYYPVTPPGAPYGSTYNGIAISSSVNSQFLETTIQSMFGPTVTLQTPTPTGSSAPTTSQYSSAVSAAMQAVLSGSAPAGVTLTSLTNEAVALRITDRSSTAASIAQSIIQFNPSTALPSLTTITQALAASQPTYIDTILPGILTQVGSNTTVAPGIPQLVATAVSAISTDLTRVSSLVNGGLAGISSSSLTASQKTTAIIDPSSGLIQALLSSSAANNNPVLIDTIVKGVTYGGYSSLVPPSGGLSSLDQILGAAVAALPTLSTSTIGALADGALRSQGGSASAIASRLATLSPATATYTNAVVGGYNTSTLSDFQNYVSANPTLADAAASGAVVKGSLTPAVIIRWALTNGTGTSAKSIVAATVGANPGNILATLVGAINTTTHTPWGSATFGDLAWGGANAAVPSQVGNVVQTILQNSSSSITTLSNAVVTSVLDNAIQGANAGGKPGTFSDIVYKAESVARNTSGASAALVVHAIDSLNSIGGSSLSYIGVVAALAGDVYGVNRSAIQNAAYGVGGELQATGGDVVAAMAGAALVQALQTNGSQKFTSMLTAFKNAAAGTSATNSVLSSLYGAILADPSDADAALAAAIKQSSVSDTVLTSNASDALRTQVTTFTGISPSLQTVAQVVTHIKSEALTGSVTDIFGYVSQQIITNPSQVTDIAVAATVIDPDHAHFISHAVAFNSPLSAYNSVAAIFQYAQITNPNPLVLPTATNPTGALTAKSFPGVSIGTIIDQPAAAAAITAGLTTGILEAKLSDTDTRSALSTTIAAAIAASLTQNGTNLRGPTNPFNAPGDTTKGFQQSDGASPTSFTTTTTVGAAGVMTGYIAEVTHAGDSTISDITKAVITASVGGGARPYALQMAQAAAQALRWVGGANVSTAAATLPMSAGNPIYDIANAMASTVTGFATLTQLENAAAFGISQAANGVIGAGALGLNAKGLNSVNGTLTVKASGNANEDFYQLRSATGDPVTDIFNL